MARFSRAPGTGKPAEPKSTGRQRPVVPTHETGGQSPITPGSNAPHDSSFVSRRTWLAAAPPPGSTLHPTPLTKLYPRGVSYASVCR